MSRKRVCGTRYRATDPMFTVPDVSPNATPNTKVVPYCTLIRARVAEGFGVAIGTRSPSKRSKCIKSRNIILCRSALILRRVSSIDFAQEKIHRVFLTKLYSEITLGSR